MMIEKCCGFIDIRPGLGILSILELIASCAQFSYLEMCQDATSESKALVATCSVVGVIGGCLLLFGIIKKKNKPKPLHKQVKSTWVRFLFAISKANEA